MKKHGKILLIIIPAALVIAGMILFYLKEEDQNLKNPVSTSNESLVIAAEVNENLVYPALEKAKNKNLKKIIGIKGGIAPHHDLAAQMIADFFSQIAENENPETIIVLGPNHSNQGPPALSSTAQWQTCFGQIKSNEKIIQNLKNQGFLTFDHSLFEKEHSIKVLTPFIKHYFPKAEIVPIIFTTEFYKYDLLARELSDYLKNENAILIGSIDFSHYLPKELADEKDKKTLRAIENRDYEFLADFNSDYFDSPASLIVLLKTMDMIRAENMSVLHHLNSEHILKEKLNETTGYYTVLFHSE